VVRRHLSPQPGVAVPGGLVGVTVVRRLLGQHVAEDLAQPPSPRGALLGGEGVRALGGFVCHVVCSGTRERQESSQSTPNVGRVAAQPVCELKCSEQIRSERLSGSMRGPASRLSTGPR